MDLGSPQTQFPSIHVAGTNGKGSVSLKIAKALEYSGYRCGLFTSPHILCFRERIAIGSALISEDDTASLLSLIIYLAKETGRTLTYFEYCTLLAFQYFACEKVDVAVIEVGLGGRLDATNIIHPIASIITSISKDHTELLGSSEEEIAREKAGIIKPFTPVLIGPRTPMTIFKAKADALQAPLTTVAGTYSHYGLENTAIARKALDLIQPHFHVKPDAMARALSLEPPCRFEIISRQPTVILDVAHNPDGISRLIQRIQSKFPTKKTHFALSFSSSKDIAGCAQLLSTIATSIHILDVKHPRLASPEVIKQQFTRPVSISLPEQFLAGPYLQFKEEDILVVCGTFFIMDIFKMNWAKTC
jgi:dihydrofolate synthase/folylpolyglutamate synthase